MVVIQSSRNDLSAELRSLQPALLRSRQALLEPAEILHPVLPKALRQPAEAAKPSSALAKSLGLLSPAQAPAPLFSFDGVGNLFGGWPPDTQGDIGPNHYIQWINLHFAVWQLDKANQTAELVYGPVPGTTLFQGFGGACENNNDGDPITLYDPFAGRWLMSQFALPYYPYSPFYQCVAVSATSDPLGAWYRYEFLIPSGKMNDYPKFGVWPNAYFMTVNQFSSGSSSWAGAGVAALERGAMLSGQPARMVYLDLFPVNPDFGGILPADFDGDTPPPDGSPGYFVEWDDSSWIGEADGVRLWEFHVDWDHPDEASFGSGGQPDLFIPTQDVDPSMCSYSRSCIRQPGTTMRVDAISDRLMYRLQYRNFGGYASLVTNHTVDADGADHAVIHWFELHKGTLEPNWSLYQEGIYAPDAANRWMGSVALDHVGNMALGYSLASSTIYPSVGYTGRLAGDPLGSMFQGETILVQGGGSQTGSTRWGDYSMMGVDPVDDCTFWYTQEYVAQSGSNTWKTRIGAFRFPGCVIGERGTIQGTVRSSPGGDPVPGAAVQASAASGQPLATLSGSDGAYAIQAPVGVYTVTASAFGFYPQQVLGVEVLANAAVNQDFLLEPAATQVISGTVRDAQTGWPLYARIRPVGVSVAAAWSDPLTGHYSLQIPAGSTFDLSAEPHDPGYQPQSAHIANLSGDLTQHFDLQVDEALCSAAGYQPHMDPFYSSDFEASDGGLTVSGPSSWAWGEIASGPGSAHSGSKGWATGLAGNYGSSENGYLTLPDIDLSLMSGEPPAISWWQWLQSEARYDFASIEASKDGGLSWQVVYGPQSGLVDESWQRRYLELDPAYAVSNLKVRFHFTSDSNVTFPGWYLDDLDIGRGACLPLPGGLVVGNVLDANSHAGLDGALVLNPAGGQALTLPTPEDAGLADGFFSLFSPTGLQTLTASSRAEYQPDTHQVDVPLNGAVRQDFELQAGWLQVSPDRLEVTLELGETKAETLQLENAGGAPAAYEWVELRGAHLPLGPIEIPVFVNKPFKADLRLAQTLGIPAPPAAPTLTAGQVLQSWIPQNVEGAWSAAFDKENQTVWVSSPSQWWGGEDSLVEFSEAGSPTGRSIPHAAEHTSGPADLAYNWNTGKLWVMNINTGVANCIYEVDPQSGYTGEKICPGSAAGFTISQRGLAYDPFSDTWFAGGWNDLMVHRFDADGNILSSVNTGLPISGLAYQPESQHLFVLTSENSTRVYVLDAADDYQLVGQFVISEGFDSYSGGGLEIDCSGNLWAVDINENRVAQFTSGEATSFCSYDIPWIEAQPASGVLAGGMEQPVSVQFDARLPAVDQPGIYSMLYKLREDTPYSPANLPVTMTVTSPPGWGKLSGVVHSTGYCGLDPQLLDDARITITSSQGITETAQSIRDGTYQRWLDAAGSPYSLKVELPGYALGQASEIQISAGQTTPLDFNLDLLQPCVRFDPAALSETVKFGRQVTATLSLENAGAAGTPFNIYEAVDLHNGEQDLDWLSVEPASGSLDPRSGWVETVVTFNSGAASITQPGVFTGTLLLETDDPNLPVQQVPLTMTVASLEYGLQLAASQTSLEGIPGETLDYSLQITNTSDGLPDSFYLEVLGSSWSAQLSPELGSLAAGESQAISLQVKVSDAALPGAVEDFSVRAVSEGDPAKQAAVEFTASAVSPSADLELQLSALPGPYLPGTELSYQVRVRNNGPTSAAEVVYINQLSPRFYYLSNSLGCSRDGQLLICRLGWLKAGEYADLTIVGVPNWLGILLNQGVVVSKFEDPDMSDNFGAIQGMVEGILQYLPWLPAQ